MDRLNVDDLVDSLSRAVREQNLAIERGDAESANLLAMAINEIRVALGGIGGGADATDLPTVSLVDQSNTAAHC